VLEAAFIVSRLKFIVIIFLLGMAGRMYII